MLNLAENSQLSMLSYAVEPLSGHFKLSARAMQRLSTLLSSDVAMNHAKLPPLLPIVRPAVIPSKPPRSKNYNPPIITT